LAVANLLPGDFAAPNTVAAAISVLDVATLSIRTNLLLPPGSVGPRALAMSPDGRWCAVPHQLARFRTPTTQVRHGWMNMNAVSLIDLAAPTVRATLILDEADRGAANPWAAAWSADGESLCITHTGTQELSVLDTAALLERLAGRMATGVIEDFGFLHGIRRRLRLETTGPRALVLDGQMAYVAGYFSDTVSAVNLDSGKEVRSIELGASDRSEVRRRGMSLFHDGRIGHQGWQSCASCHPDGRTDGLNWDLLNDGVGNPKNTKSLLLAHRTPPAMSTGVRGTAERAVRSGLRNILFCVRPEEEARAIDEYLKQLQPEVSPLRRGGELSAAAIRGRALFEDRTAGCVACHPPPLFTDRNRYGVGAENRQDRPGQKFDTPSLIECWRTAPYLHDGAAATMRDVLTRKNPQDQHGVTSHLNSDQIDDLAAYVLSL
jgi:mono/diheme cytochrome c family protein